MTTQLRRLVRASRLAMARTPLLRRIVLLRHHRLQSSHPWMRPHPFDRQNGVDTIGYYPPWIISPGHRSGGESTGYAGCQPSCLRTALAALPVSPTVSFLDLGCGKGRALVLASEHPFKAVSGIELSPSLVRTARANAEIIARKYPSRPPIVVILGDALQAHLPAGDCVIFLYHSFGRSIVEEVVQMVLRSTDRELFFVYENPVHGDLFDADKRFRRFFAAKVGCDADERGLAPDMDDSVVVWRLGGPDRLPLRGADRPINVTKIDARAEVVDLQ